MERYLSVNYKSNENLNTINRAQPMVHKKINNQAGLNVSTSKTTKNLLASSLYQGMVENKYYWHPNIIKKKIIKIIEKSYFNKGLTVKITTVKKIIIIIVPVLCCPLLHCMAMNKVCSQNFSWSLLAWFQAPFIITQA